MKKVFLIAVFALISSTVFAQGLNFSTKQKININDLIGYWKPSEQATQLFFWKDLQNNLQMQEISQVSGQELDLITLRFEENKLIVVTTFAPLNYTIESEYYFLDKFTLACIVKGDNGGAMIYKKVK
jgi:hypothetical protein